MFLNGKISNRQNREMGSLRGVVDMALKKPNSMEECIYFTRRAVDSGKIMAWVFREACSKCKQGLMGKPVDAKTGSAKIRALEYVCPSCKYTVPKAEYEDTLTCNVEYICPKCKKKMTVGVAQRVESLADRKEGFVPKKSAPFRNLIPLSEVISGTINSSVSTKKVWDHYNKLINEFGNEIKVMLNVEEKNLRKIVSEKISKNIIRNREQKIAFRPGYDGVYGVPIFD